MPDTLTPETIARLRELLSDDAVMDLTPQARAWLPALLDTAERLAAVEAERDRLNNVCEHAANRVLALSADREKERQRVAELENEKRALLAVIQMQKSGPLGQRAEAAEVENARLREKLNTSFSLLTARRQDEDRRDFRGRLVREAWVRWAVTQPSPKPSWLVPWEELPEPDREADRLIADSVLRGCVTDIYGDLEVAEAENARLRQELAAERSRR
jgi:hypothetical protein